MKHTMKHVLVLISLVGLSTAWATLAQAFPLKFPSRGDALVPGAYFRSSGHGAGYGTTGWPIDIKAVRYDGTNWQEYSNTDGNPPTNQDAYVWGAPLYAPMDGEIFACWRTAPDKPAPGVNYDFDGDPTTTKEESPMIGGNHLQIRTPTGDHVLFLGHLQDESIPPALCPLGATEDWPSNDKSCDFRIATLLPTPVPVKAGDFLGRVGHSGASGAPHLHMQVSPLTYNIAGDPCQGNSIEVGEIEFIETWAQPRSPGVPLTSQGWNALQQENPLPGEQCFWPDPVGPRMDDLYLGKANNINMRADSAGAVLGYRNDVGHLMLTAVNVAEQDGDLTLVQTVEEGFVHDVALAVPYSSQTRDIVAVVKTASDQLKLIPYRNLVRQPASSDYTSTGTIGFVEATHAPTHDGVVVALQTDPQTGEGELKLIAFEVDANNNMDVERGGALSVGAHVSDLAIDTIDNADGFRGVVTADRNGTALTVRTFEVTHSGGSGQISAVHSPTLFGNYDGEVGVQWIEPNVVVTTARRLNDKALIVITWTVDATGQLTLIESASAGEVGAMSLAAGWAQDAVSGVADSAGKLRLISWSVGSNGTGLRRAGTRDEGVVSEVALARRLHLGGTPDYLIAAVRSNNMGKLKVISYQTNFASNP